MTKKHDHSMLGRVHSPLLSFDVLALVKSCWKLGDSCPTTTVGVLNLLLVSTSFLSNDQQTRQSR
jgi:hypothetical protein